MTADRVLVSIASILPRSSLRTVEPAKQFASTYLTDGRGNVRIMALVGATSTELTGTTSWKYRTTKSKEWLPLGEYDSRNESGLYPVAVDAADDCAYVLRKTGGRDALFTIKLDGTMASKMVASNFRVDIDGIERFGRGQKVIGYNYTDDRGRIAYFDPEFDALAGSLGKALPNQPLINFEEASADGSKLLIVAKGDASPGMYYYFDRKTRRLDEVEPIRPALVGRTLAHVQTISVTAPDGVQIPAYVTLPANRSGKRTCQRSFFRTVGRALATNGASTGLRNSWRRGAMRSSNPIIAAPPDTATSGRGKTGSRTGARRSAISARPPAILPLRASPIRSRMAIVGWSYGGYAALQSVAVESASIQGGGGHRAGDGSWPAQSVKPSILPITSSSKDFVGIRSSRC